MLTFIFLRQEKLPFNPELIIKKENGNENRIIFGYHKKHEDICLDLHREPSYTTNTKWSKITGWDDLEYNMTDATSSCCIAPFVPPPPPTYMNITQWPDFVDKSKPSGGDRGFHAYINCLTGMEWNPTITKPHGMYDIPWGKNEVLDVVKRWVIAHFSLTKQFLL